MRYDDQGRVRRRVLALGDIGRDIRPVARLVGDVGHLTQRLVFQLRVVAADLVEALAVGIVEIISVRRVRRRDQEDNRLAVFGHVGNGDRRLGKQLLHGADKLQPERIGPFGIDTIRQGPDAGDAARLVDEHVHPPIVAGLEQGFRPRRHIVTPDRRLALAVVELRPVEGVLGLGVIDIEID